MRNVYRRYVISKRECYIGAHLDNIAFSGDVLMLEDISRQRGRVLLTSIDSRAHDFNWGRITVDTQIPSDSYIKIIAYTSDEKNFGDIDDLDSYITSGEDVDKIWDELTQLSKVTAADDFYVNRSGRYLWLGYELMTMQSQSPRLEALTVHFESDHMIDYLPAIYRERGGDFTRRFLSIFNSMFMDLEQRIYTLGRLFDYESAPPELLAMLAEWIALDDDPSAADADPKTLREYIHTAFYDAATLASPEGIKRTVKRLCGAEPLLIEQSDVDPNSPECRNPALYTKLYGTNPYRFFILLDENVFATRAKLDDFIQKLSELVPAHTEPQVVLLKQAIQLDYHTYLGINSIVGDFTAMTVDDNSAINYNSMLGG